MKSLAPLFIAVALLAGCASNSNRAHESTPVVTTSEILRNPEAFDGTVVTLEGWLVVGDEERSIWADLKFRDTPADTTPGTCISVIVKRANDRDLTAFNRKRVAIRGTINADISRLDTVFLGLCSLTALDWDGDVPKLID